MDLSGELIELIKELDRSLPYEIPRAQLVNIMKIHSEGEAYADFCKQWHVTCCVVHRHKGRLIKPLPRYEASHHIHETAEYVIQQSLCTVHESLSASEWTCPCGQTNLDYLFEIVNEITKCRLWLGSTCIQRHMPWYSDVINRLTKQAKKILKSKPCDRCGTLINEASPTNRCKKCSEYIKCEQCSKEFKSDGKNTCDECYYKPCDRCGMLIEKASPINRCEMCSLYTKCKQCTKEYFPPQIRYPLKKKGICDECYEKEGPCDKCGEKFKAYGRKDTCDECCYKPCDRCGTLINKASPINRCKKCSKYIKCEQCSKEFKSDGKNMCDECCYKPCDRCHRLLIEKASPTNKCEECLKYIKCKECNEEFYADEKWKTVCLECYRTNMIDKQCDTCKNIFQCLSTEWWKTSCKKCYKSKLKGLSHKSHGLK